MSGKVKKVNLDDIRERFGQMAVDAAVAVIDAEADRIAMVAKRTAEEKKFNNSTGKLVASIHVIKPKRSTKFHKDIVVCDAVNVTPIKNPGARGSKRTKSYTDGYPYPRVLEFSPKYGKPFFFQGCYEAKMALSGKIIEAVRKAVQK